MTIAITHSQFIVTIYYFILFSNHICPNNAPAQSSHGAAVQNFSIVYFQLLIIHSYSTKIVGLDGE